MRNIPMTFNQVSSFAAQFKGDREHIAWNDGNLEVPDDLYDSIMALDLSIPPPTITGDNLADMKKEASAFIDKAAEEQRLRWVTPGAGQAMTYQAKAQEAADCLALVNAQLQIDPLKFPFLAAEVGVSGQTITEVAAIVDMVHKRWAVLAAGIERVRLSAKSAIADAPSQAGIQSVLDGIEWPEVSASG